VLYASTLPITWISTGTSLAVARATVTGTSPPPPLRPPLPPPPPPVGSAAAEAPVFPQPESNSVAPARIRTKILQVEARKPHPKAADLGIKRSFQRGDQIIQYVTFDSPNSSKEPNILELPLELPHSFGLGGGNSRAATGSLKPVRACDPSQNGLF